MSDKCTIHTIDLFRLKEEVESPALSSLVEKGWEPLGTIVLDDGNKPKLHVILKPPRKIEKYNMTLIMLSILIVQMTFICFKMAGF